MSTLPVELAVSYAQESSALLGKYQVDMTAQGVNPTAIMASITTKVPELIALNAEQENLKTQLRAKTEAVGTLKDEVEKLASTACDKILATYGRTSNEAKEATQLRTRVTSPAAHRAAKPAPVTP